MHLALDVEGVERAIPIQIAFHGEAEVGIVSRRDWDVPAPRFGGSELFPWTAKPQVASLEDGIGMQLVYGLGFGG